MQRVTRSSAVVTMPAPPVSPSAPGFFTGGDPGAGQPATVPGYEWFNSVQEELLAVILRGGLTASNADLAQVRKSLDRLFGGGLASYSANTTLTVDDAGLVLVNASGGARTITLPAANALGGRPIQITIVKTDTSANAVTVQRAGSDTINGQTSLLLAVGDRVTLISDGVNIWFTVAGNPEVLVPVGTIIETSLASPPAGYVAASGALLSRTSFAALFNAANASGLVSEATWSANSWGRYSVGDGSTTFRVPDLRGEFRRGLDSGRGVDSSRGIGTSQAGAMESHTHGPASGATSFIGNQTGAGGTLGASQAPGLTATSTTGATGGAETRPRNIATLVCIKF
jgi:microcystin-dependent protein